MAVKKQDDNKTTKRKPPSNGVKFTPENQPSGEAKSIGMRRKFALRDLLSLSTGQKFEGSQKDYRDACAIYFQIQPEDVTVKMIMEFRQIEKAILKGDTQAYNALMTRGFGAPKAESDPDAPPADSVTNSVIDLGNGITFEI